MAGHARAERLALCDLFVDVGPDAPTLCEGWVAQDLAAHLVLRERRPDAAIGILFPPLAGYSERARCRIRDGRPWPLLVDAVRSGPPPPLRVVDEPFNTMEMFLHHEDVRRAAPGWEPRALDPALEGTLWRRARVVARLAARKLGAGIGLGLEAPGYGRLIPRPGRSQVILTGPPQELLLFLTGRQGAARADLSGPPEAVAAARAAPLAL